MILLNANHVYEYVEKTKRPDYEALSYTLGYQNDTLSIEVNGTVVLVTRNLHCALRYLRRLDGQRCIWVDAVCINQADLDEHNYTVCQMHVLYKDAR